MTDAAATRDPSAVATPANAVTVVRILISPLLFILILRENPSWAAFTLGFVLAVTDVLDGWLARRDGPTRSGAFLDPLADKVVVLGSLYSFAAIGRFHWLPVVLITVREMGISVYRSYWGRRGLAIPARQAAKWKTLIQGAALLLAALPLIPEGGYWVADAFLWVGVVLTVVTGALYVLDGSRALSISGLRD
ncbi:MAG: CDP-diacylglycerol--glycerol-3-phosphate 3-phosphatidyltransferase [Actinomycetia bacterium]|nr:CDP-diacylglycerol--glycerol-3-phosphate 3-phosphatidyltransferase [Actinomycetes bacterium]MCP3909387.1 CDP-diacylglycerol--glycerol-3-phosphate 3-phosphatidyltransferase [Actinomycetes bacterium]MCP4087647.1 CDP-diacylglycerol--glycerol-3-phosphate 3-phosphatidyltransferase [Actinomycetes bacterium]